jgi:hypothetical protein
MASHWINLRRNLGLALGASCAAGCALPPSRPAAAIPENAVVAGGPVALFAPADGSGDGTGLAPAAVDAPAPAAAPAAVAPVADVVAPTDLFGDYAPTAPTRAADETFGPKDNQLLVTLNGALSYIDPDHADNTSAISGNFEVGWFKTREHEIGGQLFTNVTRSTHDDNESVFLGPYYNYNWYRNPRQTFYGGPHLGLSYFKLKAPGISDSETSFAFGLHAGWRQWITPTASFNIEPRWTHTDLSSNLGGNRDELDILFGFSLIF